jgi:hypothetical protein
VVCGECSKGDACEQGLADQADYVSSALAKYEELSAQAAPPQVQHIQNARALCLHATQMRQVYQDRPRTRLDVAKQMTFRFRCLQSPKIEGVIYYELLDQVRESYTSYY